MTCENSRSRPSGDFDHVECPVVLGEFVAAAVDDRHDANYPCSATLKTIKFLVVAAVLAALAVRQSPASAADKDGKTVSGTVVKASDGSPISGATVYLLRRISTLPFPSSKTRSDAAGRFTFEDVQPGSYRLFAESGNQISSLQGRKTDQVAVTSSEVPHPVTLRLAEGCRFRVTVKQAADGRPIAHAKIRFPWGEIDRYFETDANGVVMIEGMRSEELAFQVSAAGYALGERRAEKAQPGATADLAFSLGPGGTIEGTVRDADGRPLFNVRVGATADRTPARLRLESSKTDGKGRFKIENVPIGETIELSIYQRDYLPKQQTCMLKADQKLLPMDLVLTRRPNGGSVLVTVTGPDGKPVANARLVNPGTNSAWRRYGRTNDQGECQLDNVYDIFGRHELGVTAKGYAPKQVSFDPGPPGKPSRLQVALEAGHRIHGRVALGQGRFAAGVWVFYAGGEHGELIGGRVDAGPDGRFAIDSLPKDCKFTIYSPKGYAPFKDQSLPLDTDSEVLVTLESASIVKGRVVDTVSRKTVIPYRIRVMIAHDRRPGEPAPGMLSQLVEEGLVITKSNGEFEFGDFPRGTPLRLMVTADGYQDRAIDRVVALPSNEFKPLEIRLLKLDPSMARSVSGQLTNAEGKPVAGAQVRLWTAKFAPEDRTRFPFNWTMISIGQLEQNESCQQFLTTSTDESGRYHFDGVRLAFYAEIDYWGAGIAAGRESILLPVDASQPAKFDFRAQAAARLVVEVDRNAWPKAALVALSAGQPTLDYRNANLRADESKITLEDLPAGTFNLTLENAGRETGGGRLEFDALAHREVTVKAGETVTVRFTKP